MTERGAFNVRVRVEGADRADVWRRLNAALSAFREVCPDGVEVGWAELRPARYSLTWDATMDPKPRKRK